MSKRISATTAAKRLRHVLNEVEYANERFEVERHGRLVAEIGPPEQAAPRGVRWGEALAALLQGPRPDPGFATDLEEIRRSVGELPHEPWARS